MTRLITIIALLIVKLLSAQSMSESKMEKALSFWQQSKNEEAKVLFEEVTESDAGNWLPYYYLSLLYTADAFEQRGNQETMKRLLETAQGFQDKANNLQPENAEVLIIQARILTGWILVDPMLYGRQNSADAMYILNKAAELEPENPRVALEKVLFDIGKAKYFGQDVQGFCGELQRTKELFATFKPETALHPDWGREKLAEALAKCNE
ncbi:hypothetical protein DI487_01670 [Flavobacterium sediminis]|uniref:Tetratricopeptide repeat protein n=1 Tax=Flavobacterium sediminis TaxID=2201181 RepID=A0A2U8QRC6_9FLAO|nr:hypothetical protein [Flavobacterium sediminis]AWM12703.1 hypothetical protein DI487_01670 [Flavobacterium sediminis]